MTPYAAGEARLALAVVRVEAALLVVALGVTVPVVHLAFATAAGRVAQRGALLALPAARGVEAGVVALIVGLLRWVAPGGTPAVGQRLAPRSDGRPCEGETGRAARVIADEQHEQRAARGGDRRGEGAAAQATTRSELARSGGAAVVDTQLVVPRLGAELLEGQRYPAGASRLDEPALVVVVIVVAIFALDVTVRLGA